MYVCLMCNKEFLQFRSLKTHYVIHAGGKPYVCETCNKSFFSRHCLRKHRLIHADKKPYICDVCQRGFVQKVTLKKHYLTHTKSYKCSVCLRSFASKEAFQDHLLSHSKENYICRFCEKSFSTKDELKVHKLTHNIHKKDTKERTHAKTFKCNICSQEFLKEIEWRSHFLVHASNICCDRCGELFKDNKEYELHLKNHNDVTITFLCEYCKESFLTIEELRKHELRHKICNGIDDENIKTMPNFTDPFEKKSGNYVMLCENCGEIFHNNSDFLSHLSLHNGNQLNLGHENGVKLCDICGDVFDDERKFVNHMVAHVK